MNKTLKEKVSHFIKDNRLTLIGMLISFLGIFGINVLVNFAKAGFAIGSDLYSRINIQDLFVDGLLVYFLNKSVKTERIISSNFKQVADSVDTVKRKGEEIEALRNGRYLILQRF